jgi:hypothetical protein
MASFQLCHDINKHTFDRDSISGLHPASWAVAAIGPLARMNIWGIINMDSPAYIPRGACDFSVKRRVASYSNDVSDYTIATGIDYVSNTRCCYGHIVATGNDNVIYACRYCLCEPLTLSRPLLP